MGILDEICPFQGIFLTLSKNAYTKFYAGPALNHFAYKIGLWKTFGYNNHAPVISVEIPGGFGYCFMLPVEQPSSSNDICEG